MEETHTPAGYFIAIALVLGAVWLMPPFPLFLLIAPLLLLIALVFLIPRSRL
jgi:hypothetical protein